MIYYPFNSRNALYRTKIGALAEGENLRLKVLLHNDAKVHDVFLRIKNDNEENFREAQMFPTDWIDNYRFYECEITLTEGLYWYSFRYTSDYGDFCITKTDTSLGIVSNDGGCWQQTVFSYDFKTPDWLAGGIIYQIFPDRFFKGEGNIGERDDVIINEDWDNGVPQFAEKLRDLRKQGNVGTGYAGLPA